MDKNRIVETRTNILKVLKEYFLLSIGTIIVTVGLYVFAIPNSFVMGGVTGISIIVAPLLPTWLTPATLVLILNIVLLLVGFAFLGRDFGFKTVYFTLVYSALTYLFEAIVPLKAPLTQEPLLELVLAIVLTAIGSAILFNINASSGGTDIIAMILKKYTAINVGTALIFADCIVALSSFRVFDIPTGLFSILGLFAKSFLVDGLIENFNLCKYFTIITEKGEDITEYIMKEMHRGVTIHHAIGAFTHHDKSVLLTVCKRYEAHQLKEKIKQIDPSAFIMITNSSEIIGRGFRSV